MAGNWAARGFLGTSRVESLGDGDLFAVFGNVSKVGPRMGGQSGRLAAAPWREFGEAPGPPHTHSALYIGGAYIDGAHQDFLNSKDNIRRWRQKCTDVQPKTQRLTKKSKHTAG